LIIDFIHFGVCTTANIMTGLTAVNAWIYHYSWHPE